MAHFRAVVKGNRGEASRLGSKSSGLYAKLQTWGYDLVVNVWHGSNGQDMAEVSLVRHDGSEHSRQILTVDLSEGRTL